MLMPDSGGRCTRRWPWLVNLKSIRLSERVRVELLDSVDVPFITCEGQGLDDLFYTEDRDRWLCKQRDPDDLAHKIDDCICSLAAGRMFEQRLAKDLDIDVLVGDFVKELDLHCH